MGMMATYQTQWARCGHALSAFMPKSRWEEQDVQGGCWVQENQLLEGLHRKLLQRV